MFIEVQRDALIQATEVAYDVQPITSTDEAIAAVRDRFLQRGRLPLKEWLAAKETASQLVNSAMRRFAQIAEHLTRETGNVDDSFSFKAERTGGVADPDESDVRVQLSLNTIRADALALSFVNIGHGFIRVDPYLCVQDAEPALIEGGTFQINYEEDLATAQARFSPWLERVIVAGLTAWRRSL